MHIAKMEMKNAMPIRVPKHANSNEMPFQSTRSLFAVQIYRQQSRTESNCGNDLQASALSVDHCFGDSPPLPPSTLDVLQLQQLARTTYSCTCSAPQHLSIDVSINSIDSRIY